MEKLVNDLSVLTCIPARTLDKLVDISESIIGHDVYESLREGNSHIEVDVGCGKLLILVDSENIKYRFIPSKSLTKKIENVVLHNVSPVMMDLDAHLATKLKNTYRELM